MFKPKMIEAIPYIVLEYFDSKPDAFIRINGSNFELTKQAKEIEEKIYNYYFKEKNKNDEEEIMKEIENFENEK